MDTVSVSIITLAYLSDKLIFTSLVQMDMLKFGENDFWT